MNNNNDKKNDKVSDVASIPAAKSRPVVLSVSLCCAKFRKFFVN